MKKLICVVLSLLALCALFAGCAEKNPGKAADDASLPTLGSTEATAADPASDTVSTDPEEEVNFLGLRSSNITAEQLAEALGVSSSEVLSTELSSGEELLIVNNVLYNTILYKQLQCINYGDKSVITLTHIPQDEEFDGVMDGIIRSLEAQFGAPSNGKTGNDLPSNTWHSMNGSENYIYLYPLTEEEFKLSFYLY